MHSEFDGRLLVNTVAVVKIDLFNPEPLQRLLDGLLDVFWRRVDLGAHVLDREFGC